MQTSRAQQKRATRRRLLDAAVEAFGAGSVMTTPVDQIASAAGVSKATLFFHFGSRVELLEEVAAHLYGRGLAWRPGLVGTDAFLDAWFTAQSQPSTRLIWEIGDLLTVEGRQAPSDAYHHLMQHIAERLVEDGFREGARERARWRRCTIGPTGRPPRGLPRSRGRRAGPVPRRPRQRDRHLPGEPVTHPSDPLDLVVPLSGQDWWKVEASGDVPALKVTDGPSGARGERFVGGPASVSFPCPAALGATWDPDLVHRVGQALAVETRAKQAHVLLAPTVNLQRSPLGGRHFECLSEDPVLSAHLAVAYVEGLQSEGVAACVKHLVANDTEADRFEISSEPDERTLRECSLLPFEHALRRGGAWSTMAAYNRLHGTHCSEHPRLLTTILRDEWGWDGVVDLRLVRHPLGSSGGQRRSRPRDARPGPALGQGARRRHRVRRGRGPHDRGQARAP